MPRRRSWNSTVTLGLVFAAGGGPAASSGAKRWKRKHVVLRAFLALLLGSVLFASTGTAQNLDYNGGAVLSNPAIHNVYMDFFWDSDNPASINQASIDGFTASLVNSGYFSSASQYGVGSASFTGSNQAGILCPPPIIAGVTDFFLISAWMECMSAPSPIPFTGTISGIPTPDGNTVYAVYLPSGTTIFDIASTCGSFAAYHFFGGTLVWQFVFPSPLPLLVPQSFAYTVVPMDCAAQAQTNFSLSSELDGVSYLGSHELIEAATDPIILTGWIDNSLAGFNADILKAGEAADICEVKGVPPAKLPNGPVIAAYWSNTAGTCVPDVTPPVTTAQLSPLPNGAGWNNTNVTVMFTSTDSEPGGTGVKEIHFTLTGAQSGSNIVSGGSASVTISTEGITTVTFFGIDNAGNQEAPNAVIVRMDRTPPSVNCGSPDGLWHANDVAIPCTASDSLSGLANGADASFNLTTSVPAGTETASAFTNSRTVFDVAGNSTTQGPIGPNMVDKKPPVITISQPMATQYVHSATLTLNYTVTDGGSGVGTVTPTMDGGTTVGGSGLPSGQMINLLTTLPLGPNTFAIAAADKVNNQSSASVTFTIIVTPQSILDDVNQLQGSGAISANIAGALLAKLNAALAARNAGDCATAANIYSAFINQVMAQTGKAITPAAAAILIADAQYLITHCP
jgi:hypothetical protein